MSSGQQSYRDDAEQTIFEREVQCISNIDSIVLTKRINDIRDLVKSLEKNCKVADRFTFTAIDNLTNITNYYNW